MNNGIYIVKHSNVLFFQKNFLSILENRTLCMLFLENLLVLQFLHELKITFLTRT